MKKLIILLSLSLITISLEAQTTNYNVLTSGKFVVFTKATTNQNAATIIIEPVRFDLDGNMLFAVEILNPDGRRIDREMVGLKPSEAQAWLDAGTKKQRQKWLKDFMFAALTNVKEDKQAVDVDAIPAPPVP